MIRVCPVSLDDAKQVLDLMYQLDLETDFMLLEPGERTTTLPEQKAVLDSFIASKRKTMLLAKKGDNLVGFVVGDGMSNRRNRHSLYCVIGVLQCASGQGVGRQLMKGLEAWAVKNGFTRMELTVMCHNQKAISLYQTQGFKIEGLRQHSLRVNDTYVDELMMAKLLSPSDLKE